jgi:apolipoprotein D and lipocalin family protein
MNLQQLASNTPHVNTARKLLTAILVALICSCADVPQNRLPLAKVDLNRIYGGWYIIATIPNSFEKGAVQPYDVYSERSDGDIREDFYVRFGSFDAPCKHYTVHDWVLPGTENAAWRVQPLWPLQLPFLVGYVDPQYRFVIFGEDNRKLGWIYAREPVIDPSEYSLLESHLRDLGYDPARFKRFLQSPEQLNRPGYWSDSVAGSTTIGRKCPARDME